MLFLALPDRVPFVAAEDSEPAGKLTGSRISMLQPSRYKKKMEKPNIVDILNKDGTT